MRANQMYNSSTITTFLRYLPLASYVYIYIYLSIALRFTVSFQYSPSLSLNLCMIYIFLCVFYFTFYFYYFPTQFSFALHCNPHSMLYSTILQAVGFELCSKHTHMCVCPCIYLLFVVILVQFSSVRFVCICCRYSKIVCSNQIFLLLDIVNMVGGELRWWNSKNEKKFLYIFFFLSPPLSFTLCVYAYAFETSLYLLLCSHHVPNIYQIYVYYRGFISRI